MCCYVASLPKFSSMRCSPPENKTGNTATRIFKSKNKMITWMLFCKLGDIVNLTTNYEECLFFCVDLGDLCSGVLNKQKKIRVQR